jgi:uridine kinase
LYCELRGEKELEPHEVKLIEDRMHEIAEQAIPFEKRELPLQEAEALFESSGRMDRYHAIEHRNKALVTIYNCGGMDDYFYGYMAPDTGYIKVFGLKYYQGGLIIRFPDKSSPGDCLNLLSRKSCSTYIWNSKDGAAYWRSRMWAHSTILSRRAGSLR